MNYFLKKDLISIININKKKIDFHSRYNAKERIYSYRIINRLSSLSLDYNKAWHIKKNLTLKKIIKGAKILEGTHDFSTFRASSCAAKSPIKKMNAVIVKKKKNKDIMITFRSKSFLQNQVRSMVGCLKYIWQLENGKIFKDIKFKKRSFCAPPAPAMWIIFN